MPAQIAGGFFRGDHAPNVNFAQLLWAGLLGSRLLGRVGLEGAVIE